MTKSPSADRAPLAESLRGIRVLDLSRLLPGPFLTMVLADMGADVVKIEDPRVGDYLRAFPPAKGGISGRFLAVNRGKRSIALDLKAPAGVKLDKPSLAKPDAAEFGEHKARFDVPFSAEKGAHQLSANVDFAVCTPETCVPDQRTVAVSLSVK